MFPLPMRFQTLYYPTVKTRHGRGLGSSMGWVGSEIFTVEMGWVGFSYQNLYIFRYYSQVNISLFTCDCFHLVFLAVVWI